MVVFLVLKVSYHGLVLQTATNHTTVAAAAAAVALGACGRDRRHSGSAQLKEEAEGQIEQVLGGLAAAAAAVVAGRMLG